MSDPTAGGQKGWTHACDNAPREDGSGKEDRDLAITVVQGIRAHDQEH